MNELREALLEEAQRALPAADLDDVYRRADARARRSRRVATAVVLSLAVAVAGSAMVAAHQARSSQRVLSLPPPAQGALPGGSATTASAAASTVPAVPGVGPPAGPVPSGFAAASVTFVSDTEGWVLGTARCPGHPCTSVLRTTDGGSSWVGIPAPSAPLQDHGSSTASISAIRFADPSNGFAFGPALWSTHDGGRSWHEDASVGGIGPYWVLSLVTTPGDVYALVAGLDPVHGGFGGHVRLVSGPVKGDSFQVIADFGAGQGYPYRLIQAGSTAFAVGHRLYSVTGSTVTALSLPTASCNQLAASSPTALLVVCGGGVAMGGMGQRSVYGSVTGGRTWTRLPDPGQGSGYDPAGVADNGGGHAVIGTVSQFASGLLATSNGGRTWAQVLVFTGDRNGGFADLAFEDARHGVVINGPRRALLMQGPAGQPLGPGEGTLYRTDDGGLTWHLLHFGA